MSNLNSLHTWISALRLVHLPVNSEEQRFLVVLIGRGRMRGRSSSRRQDTRMQPAPLAQRHHLNTAQRSSHFYAATV